MGLKCMYDYQLQFRGFWMNSEETIIYIRMDRDIKRLEGHGKQLW